MKLLLRLLVLCLTIPSLCLSAQVLSFPAGTVVGFSAQVMTATLRFQSAGAIANIKVTTNGSELLDFQNTGVGTCVKGLTYQVGQTCTVAITFTPTHPGERRGAVILLDVSGNTLASALMAGVASGPVATFVPGTITTVAGNQAWVYAGDGGLATQSSIFLPFGLAVDAAGSMYIADSNNNRIRKVDVLTGMVSTIAGTGIIGTTGDKGPATSAALSSPSSIVLDPLGNIYFSDSGNNVVRRIDAFTGILSTIAGVLGTHGYTGDGLHATAATLNGPNGLAFDAAGNLYIADTGNHVIRLLNASTGIMTTVAGTGAAGYSGDGGAAVSASLNGPWSVTLSTAGELYIADQNNNRIRKVDLAKNISTIAGNGSVGFSGDGKAAAQAQLNVPASIAIDVAGNIYIADAGNNRIRKINASTGLISTIAGSNGESMSGDNGPADQAGLYGPYALVLDGADNLFIADVFHNRIRKISSGASTLLFDPIRVGRVSPSQLQKLENDGNAPLTFSALLSLSNSQIDQPNTVCSTSTSLAPLDTCQISVAFAPSVTGTPTLGTVSLVSNASNSPGLITLSGNVLNTDPTSLILATSANPGSTGVPITFSVTASSAGTIPTGSITFLDGGNVLGTAPLLTGGLASLQTSSLSSGQHNITASYAGDTSNAAAVSTVLVETVKDSQAATITTLTSSANPISGGASLTLNAVVSTKNQGSGTATISGNVTFFDGSTNLGTISVSSAGATSDKAAAVLNLTSLSLGTHVLTATYAGTPTDAASTSSPVTEVVQIATTKLALSASANPVISGAPLTLSASVLGTGGVPTGSVTFYSGSSLLGTSTLTNQGTATFAVPNSWTPGTYLVTATYTGDPLDSPATSLIMTELVSTATTSLSVTSSLNPAGSGAQVLLTASATSNGGIPSGTIQFMDGQTSLGTAALNASGIASLAVSSLTIGTHPITAVYTGDVRDTAAVSAVISQIIQAATIAITLDSSKNPSLFGDKVTFTVHVSGTGSVPVGRVNLSDGATALATVTLGSTGQATFLLDTLAIGAHSLTATYGGDVNHAAATSAPLQESVLQITSTTLVGAAVHGIAGLPVVFHASVVGASGKSTGGTILLTDGATTLASLTPDASGLATYAAILPIGQHTLLATYSGDALNAASVSTSAPLLVEIATTNTTLSTSANPSFAGTPLTITAKITGNGGTPAGSVTLRDGSTSLATVPVDSTGSATLTVATLTPGIHPLTAVYSGDTNDQTSTSPSLSQQIALRTTLSLTSSANPSLLTDNVVLTITAANGSSAPPTGSVTLADGGNAFATIALVNGSGTATLTAPGLGNHTLTATYAGDNQNQPANSAALVQLVTLRPSTTGLTVSSSALSAGQQLILISVVRTSGPQLATGTVTFQSGSSILGTTAISTAGVATITLTPAQASLNIVAAYSGDSLYSASTSAASAVTVGPPVEFTINATPASMSMPSGQHGTLTLSIVSAPTFKDSLAFGCAGLPADATCTFSNTQLVVTPGLPQTLQVTVDTGNPLGAGASASVSGASRLPVACLLPAGALLALLLVRRRKSTRGFGVMAMLLLLGLALGAVTGCGSSFSQSTTPAGTYSFRVVATGQATTASQSAVINLTVTK